MTGTLSESKKELLGKLLRGRAIATASPRGMPRRREGGDAPISYGQQQIWLHSQYSSQLSIYNEMITIHHYGALDRTAFERAFTEIIRRHEAWRTTFRWKDGELLQHIEPPPAHISIPCLDVSAVSGEAREATALLTVRAEALAPYDLSVGPMYRPHLVRFSEEEHRFYLGLHHIIFDGVSLYGVLLPELQSIYEAFSQNKPSPLEDLPLQYADYAVWHRQWVDEIAPKQLEYWRSKLKGASERDILPIDYPRTETQSYRGATERIALDVQLSAALKDLSQRSGVTLFMTLLATLHVLIWAYTREEEMIIGCTSAGRDRSETDHLLGFFLNTIVLRTDLSRDPTFLEVVRRGREELLSSLAHDGIPFESVVKALCVQRDSSRHPFFQVMFGFQPPLAPLKPNWKFAQMDLDLGVTKFDLHLELDERQEGIIGRFIYNADLFERETIKGMIETWRNVVYQVVADPSRRISQLVPELTELRKTRFENERMADGADVGSVPSRPIGLIRSIQRLLRSNRASGS
jgi:surfactin family lipopeptide synthetase A